MYNLRVLEMVRVPVDRVGASEVTGQSQAKPMFSKFLKALRSCFARVLGSKNNRSKRNNILTRSLKVLSNSSDQFVEHVAWPLCRLVRSEPADGTNALNRARRARFKGIGRMHGCLLCPLCPCTGRAVHRPWPLLQKIVAGNCKLTSINSRRKGQKNLAFIW